MIQVTLLTALLSFLNPLTRLGGTELVLSLLCASFNSRCNASFEPFADLNPFLSPLDSRMQVRLAVSPLRFPAFRDRQRYLVDRTRYARQSELLLFSTTVEMTTLTYVPYDWVLGSRAA
jgi:hypothetical protein